MQPEYDETARRQFYNSVYVDENDGDCKIKKDLAAVSTSPQFFLQGGFLLDKQTALPARLGNSGDNLVVHKDKIGNDGKILLSRMDHTGKVSWTLESNLKEWIDWIVTADRLYIFGADNPSLSGDDCNVLLCVDLASGKVNRYDYFNNK
jgi:hypothetical protein